MWNSGIIASRHTGKTWFVSVWETTTSNETITLPYSGGNTTDWGDGTVNTLNSHAYTTIGQYTIKIEGEITGWAFNGVGDKDKILNISSWGNLVIGVNGFRGCANLDVTDTKNPTLSTSLGLAFFGCDDLLYNDSVKNWNVSSVTSLFNTFSGCSLFNQPLNSWDVSNVISFHFMFNGATAFNKTLDNWITTSVTNTESMFKNSGFNQPIESWDMSGVTNTSVMFWACPFNQTLNGWDIGNVTTINGMFALNSSFNQPLNSWNTSKVEIMFNCFNGATAFNQNISSWDFTKVKNLNFFMFGKSSANYDATYYDDLLIKWDSDLVFANMTNVNINMGSIKYTTAGVTARTNLVNKGFIITDGGLV